MYGGGGGGGLALRKATPGLGRRQRRKVDMSREGQVSGACCVHEVISLGRCAGQAWPQGYKPCLTPLSPYAKPAMLL